MEKRGRGADSGDADDLRVDAMAEQVEREESRVCGEVLREVDQPSAAKLVVRQRKIEELRAGQKGAHGADLKHIDFLTPSMRLGRHTVELYLMASARTFRPLSPMLVSLRLMAVT